MGFLSLAPLPILCERATHPELGDRPFTVIGAVGNRGLVIAASAEAVRAGVRPGITPDAARAILPGIHAIEERPVAYFETARAVQDLCERFVPIVEAERQDAFALDLTGCDRLYPDAEKLIRILQQEIRSEVSIPSRAGLGASRLVARLAALRAPEQDIRAIPPGEEAAFLVDYKVTVLPWVGARIAERLRWLGVHTVGELARVPVQTLEAAFGPRGLELARAARGHDPHPRRHAEWVKPLKRETTIEQLFHDPLVVRIALEKLTAELGLDLRRAAKQTRRITLELCHPDSGLGPSDRRARKQIPPTDSDSLLQPIVEEMCDSAFTRRVRIRAISLSYGKLIPRDDQLRLAFATDPTLEQRKSLEKTMDMIRNRWGVDTIGPGMWWRRGRNR